MFNSLDEVTDLEQGWESYKTTLTTAATNILSKSRRRTKSKWMTNKILQRIEERRQVKNKGVNQCKKINNEIRHMCHKLNKMAEEMRYY